MSIYLVEKDDCIIGKVHLQLINGIGGIYGLGVLPENRGKGFGRAILLNAIEKLKDAKAEKIMLQVAAENATALSLYKSCGFKETSVMDYFELGWALIALSDVVVSETNLFIKEEKRLS